MIITTESETILGNGAKSRGFSIQANKKVFKILSSDLYSNKIRAVVRELITNMIDAHLLNGCTDQFIVSAPGKLDPRFVCRDFGPGMSDFQIRGNDEEPGLYNTYFASSKTESNDFIGGFGLGSKSPFAYTETFSVTSYHNGEIRGYIAYQDDNGPQIKPTFTKEMGPDDRTGIEIVVPVAESDFRTFHGEIAYIMRPFNGLADVKGLDREINYFPEFDNYYALDNGYGIQERYGVYAIYGGIVYPLDDVVTYSTWLRIRNDVVYIKFPMGELDIAPSREALSIDNRTRENINRRVKEIDDAALAEDIKRLQEIECPRHAYREVANMNYNARTHLTTKDVKFSKEQLTYKQLYSRFDVQNYLCNFGVAYGVHDDPRLKRIKQQASSTSVVSVHKTFGINSSKINIVITDMKNRVNIVRGLAKALYDDKFTKKSKLKIGKGSDLFFIDPESQTEMDLLPEVLKLFEGDEVNIYRLSELNAQVKDYIPKVDRTTGPRTKTPTVYNHRKDENGNWTVLQWFMPVSDVEDIDAVMVFQNRADFYSMDGQSSLGNPNISHLRKLADVAGVKEFNVIRPVLQQKILKLELGECLFQLARDKFIEQLDAVDYTDYIGYSHRGRQFTDKIIKYPELEFMLKYFSNENVNPEFTRLANMHQVMNNIWFNGSNNSAGADIRRAVNIYNRLLESASSGSDTMVKQFTEKFKLVAHYMDYFSSFDKEAVVQIVKTMKALEA